MSPSPPVVRLRHRVTHRLIATRYPSEGILDRVASPEDLDSAVMLGLGYPKGPLGMGDAIGAPKILVVLEAMHAFYQEPRYRPSPWLKRRAKLGISLLTPE